MESLWSLSARAKHLTVIDTQFGNIDQQLKRYSRAA